MEKNLPYLPFVVNDFRQFQERNKIQMSLGYHFYLKIKYFFILSLSILTPSLRGEQCCVTLGWIVMAAGLIAKGLRA